MLFEMVSKLAPTDLVLQHERFSCIQTETWKQKTEKKLSV